ncbi:hypothetical protein VKT23_010619 [Stygiomarasmius scandens]|uniref:Uncharacterized protein n=1 Tax=Marasmiellus scandens TaxID=2682957 RepID=A0ABR1JBE7_9AGAR
MQRTYSIFLSQECAAKGTLSETLCDSTNAELFNLLRAGQAPSYAQVSETFIDELQDAVVNLQSVLDQVKGRMDKLKRRIELQPRLGSSIRNLPAELLADIQLLFEQRDVFYGWEIQGTFLHVRLHSLEKRCTKFCCDLDGNQPHIIRRTSWYL